MIQHMFQKTHIHTRKTFIPNKRFTAVCRLPYRYTNLHQRKPAPPVNAFIWSDPVTTSYFIGKGIILFTMFYCTMNWWYYKRMQEDDENDD